MLFEFVNFHHVSKNFQVTCDIGLTVIQDKYVYVFWAEEKEI